MHLAVTRPDQLSSLVLVAPTVDRGHRSFVAQVSRLAVDAFHEPPRLFPLVAVDYAIFMRRGGLRLVRPALADRLEAKLPSVAQPTLVVRGSRDPVVTQRWSEDVAALLPNGTLQVVEGAPHAVNFAQPRALAELIGEFLNGTGEAGSPLPKIPGSLSVQLVDPYDPAQWPADKAAAYRARWMSLFRK